MKPNFTRSLILLLAIIIHQAATAQTIYTVTSNENWSAVVTSTDCNNCTINISSGVTVTFNGGGQCTSCTFNGGTLSFQSGSGGFGWYSGNVFNNETLLYNTTMATQGGNFYQDSIYLNTSQTFTSNTTYWTNSHVEIAAGVNVTTTSTLTATNSTIAMVGTTASPSEFQPNGGSGLILSSSQMYLNGTSFISSTAQIYVENTSQLYVGDGTAASTAYLYYNTSGLTIDGTSLIKIQNDNNYIYDWGGYTTSSGSVSTTSAYASSINCGTGYAHSCGAPYVYGCATLNSGGVVACTVLALADITLTAVPAGANVVNLSWSDAQSTTANHYLVQRSTDNGDWTTLATVSAGGYTAGDYQFEDPAAPTGTDNYRIARVDQNGAVLYSAISSVTIAPAATAGNIRLYPNPATGHTFFVTTTSAGDLVINIFSMSGQLLMRSALKGQTQYQVLLPSTIPYNSALIVQVIGTEEAQTFTLITL